MDEVKMSLPIESIEAKMNALMENGTEIATRLEDLTERGYNVDNPKDFLSVFSEGMEMLGQLKTICDDLSVLNELHTLSEKFGE